MAYSYSYSSRIVRHKCGQRYLQDDPSISNQQVSACVRALEAAKLIRYSQCGLLAFAFAFAFVREPAGTRRLQKYSSMQDDPMKDSAIIDDSY
jgi:hypothetical protein